jgi:serine-type D-Ala-D-Ala carboxypeptidase (penicillin-binding protein 5/6)
MKRALSALTVLALALCIFAPQALAAPLTYPVRLGDPWTVPPAPDPTAPSWVLYDAGADAVLASENPDERRSIASVTKIMTGLLVVERGVMDEEVVVSETAAATGEKEIDLVVGETVTVGELFKALMIHSANDAATALAEHIGGSLSGFVDMMNQRSEELGLANTHFANPHGLDAPNHYSSASDVLVMARMAMTHPLFAETAKAQSYVFPPDPDGNLRVARSTNLMLADYEGMAGVKTGFTLQALLTFASAAERDGRMIYAIVLGSDGRRQHFADAEILLDYAFEDMPYYQMLSSRQPYVSQLPQVSPGPVTVALGSEALMHIAAEGLLSDQPGPVVAEDESEPPPVIETSRVGERGPDSVWEMLTYWFTNG